MAALHQRVPRQAHAQESVLPATAGRISMYVACVANDRNVQRRLHKGMNKHVPVRVQATQCCTWTSSTGTFAGSHSCAESSTTACGYGRQGPQVGAIGPNAADHHAYCCTDECPMWRASQHKGLSHVALPISRHLRCVIPPRCQ